MMNNKKEVQCISEQQQQNHNKLEFPKNLFVSDSINNFSFKM